MRSLILDGTTTLTVSILWNIRLKLSRAYLANGSVTINRCGSGLIYSNGIIGGGCKSRALQTVAIRWIATIPAQGNVLGCSSISGTFWLEKTFHFRILWRCTLPLQFRSYFWFEGHTCYAQWTANFARIPLNWLYLGEISYRSDNSVQVCITHKITYVSDSVTRFGGTNTVIGTLLIVLPIPLLCLCVHATFVPWLFP